SARERRSRDGFQTRAVTDAAHCREDAAPMEDPGDGPDRSAHGGISGSRAASEARRKRSHHSWARAAWVSPCSPEGRRLAERRTRSKVAARFDTEATKSLGLVELLMRERDRPRCDVFWNNELLGTMDLAGRGVLAPYRGPGWEGMPAAHKDPDARWTGFAARFRVHIVNTTKLSIDDPRVTALAQPEVSGDLSRAAAAKPLYGTTLTHYAVWWQIWGADKLRNWHIRTRELGLRELNGNGAVKDAVAQGACDD